MIRLPLPFVFPDPQRSKFYWGLYHLYVSDTEGGHNWNGTRPMTLLYFPRYIISESVGLVFSFQWRRPVSTSYQWNCSKSEWPELYRHFPCDGQLQCLDGEDETYCYYHSDDCGPGKITVAGSCFFIIRDSFADRKYRSEAEQQCERQGAILASFDSFRQWDSLVSTLQGMGHSQGLWIDMHSVRSTMKTSEDTYMKNMYINTWQWGSGGSVVYNFHASFHQECNQAYLSTTANDLQKGSSISTTLCSGDIWTIRSDSSICKMPTPSSDSQLSHDKIIIEAQTDMAAMSRVPLATCPSGHVIHVALACDPDSQCLEKQESLDSSLTVMCKAAAVNTAAVAATVGTPYFRCAMTGDSVPYSLVCDWRQDCADNSDESFCHFPPCTSSDFDCGQRQCVSLKQVCDKLVNCETGRDELYCDSQPTQSIKIIFNLTRPPALVSFDRPGSFSLIALPGNTTQCPDSHFRCPGNGYCLPVYTRCNGMTDCPGHEDEAGCDEFTCKGLYRCRGKDRQICLHVDHLCDGWPQCPQQDDEQMCELTDSCPDQCVCYGQSFTRLFLFQPEAFPKLRYLEGRGSGLTLDVITNQTMLIYLGAGACGWRNLSAMHLPNLHVLDISGNIIQYMNFSHLSELDTLKELDLSNNPLSRISMSSAEHRLDSLLFLNLSRVSYHFRDLHSFSYIMPQIEGIDFSHSGLKSLQGRGLFRNLKTLDLQGCTVSDFSPEFMKEMGQLQQLLADDFMLCCSAVLPDSFVGICIVPEDEISSCDNLLKSGSYRAAIVIFIIAALLGNLCSIVYRIWSLSSKQKVGYAVFVIHLSVSDFFMGVYLLIIGIADRLYAGQALIYWSVRANTMSNQGSNCKENVVIKDKTRSKEAAIARRLLVVAMSDFLCWFPIGVCGLLAKLDVPVPGEINTHELTITNTLFQQADK
ncbi:uncharacterized protein LOC143277369 [Babylonia areolata]|uniref:uncharacterized protein LOC143277369 n=1 Tax=Babylonia areolata TaxID=304850 RepID=UPI003FD24256